MDRQTSPSLGTPAPYGQACVSCSQSKCRCIIRHAGGPCERCRRLNRECRPAETVRRRRGARKAAVSETARLEEKLDHLVTLIKSGKQTDVAVTSSHISSATDSCASIGTTLKHAHTATLDQNDTDSVSRSSKGYSQRVSVLTPSTDGFPGSSYHVPPAGVHETTSEPSPVEAENYLGDFQACKSKYVPFLHIPSTTTAHQLREERPFLWLCIMAICSKSISQQQALGNRVRQTAAHEIVFQSERSLDLLLGILTFVGWGQHQKHMKPFLTVFTQLATSLVLDLGLDKPVLKDTQMPTCVKGQYWKPLAPRPTEERRAVLGCFLVSSMMSSFLQKKCTLRWTTYMDECLQVLDERKEFLNDEILVQQVRLQMIVDKMTSRDGAMESTTICLERVESQLRDLKAEFQPPPHRAVILHLHSVELEIILSTMFLRTDQSAFPPPKSLNVALDPIRSWFEVFFTINAGAYNELPFSIFSQLSRCLFTLYRLTALDDPGWDKSDDWTTSDSLLILDQTLKNLEVAAFSWLDNNDNPESAFFSQAAQMLRPLRPAWEAKLGADTSNLSAIPLSNETFSLDAGIEFFDNDWLMDLLLSPNYPTNY